MLPLDRCALYIFCILAILISYNGTAISLTGNGRPLKYISSCELDFNNDNEPDVALLVETLRGRELIVLIKATKGYGTYVLEASSRYLSCHVGKFIKETPTGKGEKEGKLHKTPGAYIQLAHPEGPAAAYFWNGSGFKEVWTSD